MDCLVFGTSTVHCTGTKNCSAKQNEFEDIYLCRGGLSVREMVEGPITRENKEAIVERGWGHMEEHTVNASGKLVRLVAAQAKSLT